MKPYSLKSIVSTFSLVFLLSCNGDGTKNDFDPNFVHSVYVWLKNPESMDDRKTFENALDQLFSNSKYAKTNYLGTPAGTPRKVVDNSYTYAIIVTFSSKEEQDLYQTEPAHLQFLKDASSLWDKVVIYDAVLP